MSDQQFIIIEAQGTERIIHKIEMREMILLNEAKKLAEKGGEVAESTMRLYAGYKTGYISRHLRHTKPQWRPGGPGGGVWEVTAGVTRGRSDHPFFVNFGTGLYVGRGWITGIKGVRIHESQMESWMDSYGKMDLGMNAIGRDLGLPRMNFIGSRDGRRVSVYFTRGQQGKNFLYEAYQTTQIYMRSKLILLGRSIVNV
jgi:hypothetical protein